jgi:hypothetical protein
MKGTLATTIAIYAGQSGGSSLINHPGDVMDTPKVKDIARHRLVRTNPDVDAMSTNETQQTDVAGFVGKKYKVQDTKYGHLVSEHDSSASAGLAEQARPYSRVLRGPDWKNTQKARNASIKKTAKVNPDVL